MSETYVECLVKSEANIMVKFGKYLLIALTVGFLLIGFLLWPAMFIALATGIGAYFVYLQADLEFEYLYLDKELSVDKVMAKSKRKKVGKFDIERMEIFAPIKSHQLDSYKNRQYKVLDYSTRKEEQPDTRYVMYYDGNTKIILSPSPELIKAIKNVAPRKVFTD